MIHKIICVVTGLAVFLIVCGLEGDGITVGQATLASIPTCALLLWSFWQTDWMD